MGAAACRLTSSFPRCHSIAATADAARAPPLSPKLCLTRPPPSPGTARAPPLLGTTWSSGWRHDSSQAEPSGQDNGSWSTSSVRRRSTGGVWHLSVTGTSPHQVSSPTEPMERRCRLLLIHRRSPFYRQVESDCLCLSLPPVSHPTSSPFPDLLCPQLGRSPPRV
jgi:hypothetical protein